MFKKLLSLVLVGVMAVCMGTTVFAAEAPNNIPTATKQIITNGTQKSIGISDSINIVPQSTSLPTKYWNLANGNSYGATLTEVRVSWLYTNYFFHANSNGKLNIDYTIYSDTGRGTQMKVGVYDLTQGKFVTTFTSGESSLKGLSESWVVSGLSKTDKYAVAFVAVFDGMSRDSVHGTATIYQ